MPDLFLDEPCATSPRCHAHATLPARTAGSVRAGAPVLRRPRMSAASGVRRSQVVSWSRSSRSWLVGMRNDIDITPNSSGLPGIAALGRIVGAVMTVGLILSALALILAAIVWGFGANSSNPSLASRGKVGVVVACGAALLCGAAVTLVNFFWHVGQSVPTPTGTP